MVHNNIAKKENFKYTLDAKNAKEMVEKYDSAIEILLKNIEIEGSFSFGLNIKYNEIISGREIEKYNIFPLKNTSISKVVRKGEGVIDGIGVEDSRIQISSPGYMFFIDYSQKE